MVDGMCGMHTNISPSLSPDLISNTGEPLYGTGSVMIEIDGHTLYLK